MPEWMVRLTGPERDLRFLSTYVHDPEWQIIEDGGDFYLRAGRPDGLAGAGEAKRAADEIIDWANLTAPFRFEHYRGVKTATVLRVSLDGSRDLIVSRSERIGMSETSVSLVSGEATLAIPLSVVGSRPTPPSDYLRDRALLKRRPSLEKAMRHLRDEPGWSGYWKAAEALGEEIAGLKHVHALLGWASKDQFERFEKTVHHHRHHRVPAPPNPMSESEAKAFIIDLLRRCLEWNLAGRPKPA